MFLHTILHTNVCYQWVQKQPKFSKFLKKCSKFQFETSFGISFGHWNQNCSRFMCFALEVPFLGYPEMPKIKLLGTQKKALLVLNTNIREQFWIQCPKLIPKLVSNWNFEICLGILKILVVFYPLITYICMWYSV